MNFQAFCGMHDEFCGATNSRSNKSQMKYLRTAEPDSNGYSPGMHHSLQSPYNDYMYYSSNSRYEPSDDYNTSYSDMYSAKVRHNMFAQPEEMFQDSTSESNDSFSFQDSYRVSVEADSEPLDYNGTKYNASHNLPREQRLRSPSNSLHEEIPKMLAATKRLQSSSIKSNISHEEVLQSLIPEGGVRTSRTAYDSLPEAEKTIRTKYLNNVRAKKYREKNQHLLKETEEELSKLQLQNDTLHYKYEYLKNKKDEMLSLLPTLRSRDSYNPSSTSEPYTDLFPRTSEPKVPRNSRHRSVF